MQTLTRTLSMLGAWLAAGVLALAAIAKLVPAEDFGGSIVGNTAAAAAIAVAELALGVALCLPRSRGVAALLGSMLAGAIIVVACVRLIASEPVACGCFGGWVELQPLVQSAFGGTLLVLLAPSAAWPARRDQIVGAEGDD